MPTGSLRTCAPAGIRTDALPPKVTGWIVPGTASAPRPATATVTWPTCSGDRPKALVSSSLIGSPPTLVKMMSRTVWLSKPTAATVPGMACCGLALQLVTQLSPRRAAAAGRETAKTAMAATRTSKTAAPGSPRRMRRLPFRRPVQLVASMVSPHSHPEAAKHLSRCRLIPVLMSFSVDWEAITISDRGPEPVDAVCDPGQLRGGRGNAYLRSHRGLSRRVIEPEPAGLASSGSPGLSRYQGCAGSQAVRRSSLPGVIVVSWMIAMLTRVPCPGCRRSWRAAGPRRAGPAGSRPGRPARRR